MVAGCPPFKEAKENDDAWYSALNKKKNKHYWKLYPSVSEEFKSLVTAMLKRDPSERPDLAGISFDSWTKGPVASKENVKAELQRRRLLM